MTEAPVSTAPAPAGTGKDQAYNALEHELGVLLRRARALSAGMMREVHPDLDPAAYGLLVGLRECAPARPSDLADYFKVGKATMSRQLKVLEGLGLIERRPDPDDRRAHLFDLTPEGRCRMDAVSAARQESFHQLLGAWPEEDVRVLATMLARFNRLVETATKPLRSRTDTSSC
ncbi:MarR family winged helix-turn-helix transcriptional regulator [Actinoallomurus soli]|uniref:MarR family winged helix-turn-helix transcriptional regulator n=1 Tax=Actinoallomurus soli TaxID=2952535 RepID=UPI002093A65D|nr:MarR family winged helix-turn-helix transcriptional regulator [Actinoallomurus soli]MCO5968557.1 MarR family winged helix-turn-helix transcriptional regulator [Actinoallomurus soli]